MKFSRRHYVAIAETLRCEVRYRLHAPDYKAIVSDFCEMFRLDNPRFKPSTFIAACYPRDALPHFVMASHPDARKVDHFIMPFERRSQAAE